MKIIKRMRKNGREYVIIGGVTGKTMLDDIAKKYSKHYLIPAFTLSDSKKGTIILIKREKPLSKPYSTWYQWEYPSRGAPTYARGGN